MVVLQQLTLTGTDAELIALLDRIEERLDDGWTRNRREEQITIPLYPDGLRACFSCAQNETRPAAELWLWSRGEHSMSVTSVIPTDLPELSATQFNRILREFHGRFAAPAAAGTNVRVVLTEPGDNLPSLLSSRARQKLDQVAAVKPGTLMTRLNLEHRWQEFVIAAHQADNDLDADVLALWLVKRGWPGDVAEMLASQFDQQRALLKEYDKQLETA